jgi:HEAT repeat protein
VIKALVQLQDVRGAQALVEHMEVGSERQSAFDALKEMGEVAEPAVIDAVSSKNPELSSVAIELLGRMGTKKSFPTLRKMTRSKDEETASLAKKSLTAAIDRQKAAKAAKARGER